MPDPHAAALAGLAALLADRTRAALLLALLDGRAWTPGELARHAGVAPSTISGHLARLTEGGLITHTSQGRHRYVRIAGPDVAELIEGLTGRIADAPAPVRSLRDSNRRRALAAARTCYDHLAGRLGVAVADAMTRAHLLGTDGGFALTDKGIDWFAGLGIDLRATRGRRPLVRECLDWTERRPHLAGTAGAALCTHALDRGWLRRVDGTRALRVTDRGRDALRDLLDLDLTAAGADSPSRG